MKRKFISALMFGALIVASSGTFVSCSDNDDDIASLNDQASSLKSQLEKQVTALDEAKAALEEEIKSAKESAASAIAKAEAAQQAASSAAESAKAEAIAQANTYAQQAAEEAAKAAAAEAKKQAVEEATAAAQALINSIEPGLTAEQVDAAIADKLTDVIARIKAIEDADYLTLSDLSDYLKKSDLDLTSYATKEALQTAINELKNQYVAVETYNNFLKGDFKTLSDLVSSIQQDVNSLKGTFTGAAAEKWNKTSEQLSALLNGFEGTTLQEALTSITDRVKALEDAAAKGEFTEAEKASIQELIDATIGDIKTQVEKINADLLVLITQELRSLVFQPDFYYQGIEALKAATYNYNAITLKNATVNADDDFSNDGADKTADKVTSMVPNLLAFYHLNPSNAIMSTDKSRYSFNVLNSEFLKASTEKVVPEVLKAEPANGMVKITASYSNAELIKSISEDNAVTVMALQYKVNDSTTITSDYAAIRAITYNKIALAHVQDGAVAGTETHLYTTAAAAIANAESHADVEVAWNGTVDLDSVVQAHYRNVEIDEATDPNCLQWDVMAATKKVQEAGFKYEYALVGYTTGKNETSQSAHAAIAADGHTLRAQMPANGKQQAYGASQSKAEIGRQPLVRVTLIDTIHGNAVAAVGYIRLVIVDTKTTAAPYTTTDAYAYSDAYNLVCEDDNVLTKTLTWSQVEEKIIAKLNISKENFEANYKLDADNNGIAIQYVDNTADSKLFSKEYGNPFGVIKENTDAGSTNTSTLTWTVDNNTAYQHFKQEGKTSVTVYIRYKTAGGSVVCVPFTWTPSAINIDPKASIVDADKIAAYWYAKDNKTAGSGYHEIHGNVAVAYQDYNTSAGHFVFDVTSTFEGNTIKLNGLAAAYSALEITPEFTFMTPEPSTVTGYSTKSYVLSASADGTQFLAAPATNPTATVAIAEIVPSTGVVTYKDNATAIDLLNKADHDQLANALTGKISIKANACQPAGSVTLTNNTFDVKFLRPVKADGGTAAVVDGETKGSEAKVTMSFTDWRDHNFNNSAHTKGLNYYSYYGVTSITPDYDGMTTDMTGEWKNLSEVTNKLQITYNAPSAPIATSLHNGSFGTINYKNNGNTIGTCHVILPLTVKYDWGELKTNITITITGTIGNKTNRR